MNFPWHLYLMGILYFIAGINHFIKPNMYAKIIPPYIPAHFSMVYLSGIAEILLGIGVCFTATKNYAIYGIITMLILFFTVHFYMLSSPEAGAGLPKWLLILRIPLQLLLIWWAWYYLRF
ncbi:hypothetical protein [Zunongwangia sp.]|uniref:DoxX family protein n=1 Tax=Zunongwangia sp. TaxID=1965325 RepID=UPI003AA8DEC7